MTFFFDVCGLGNIESAQNHGIDWAVRDDLRLGQRRPLLG